MSTPAGRERALDRVTRLCGTDLPARRLRQELLDQIRQVVAFGCHVFVMTDPVTCVGSDPLADVPMLGELPRLIRLKYATTVNRWTALGDPPVALLRQATGGQPERSLLWREMLGPAGVTDVASTVFSDRYGCWGFLDLWRCAPDPPFTNADAAFLAAVAKPVARALRRCQASTFTAGLSGSGHRAPLVLLLSPELVIRGQTPQTHDYLSVLLPPQGERTAVPAVAYNVGAQLLAAEAGVDDHPPAASVHLADGVWLTVRAARLDAPADGGPADLAVTIEQTAPADRLAIFSRAFGLSGRETELLGILAGGADTGEAAVRMLLSPHTVQDHLKAIFAKTGTGSRRELLAAATA